MKRLSNSPARAGGSRAGGLICEQPVDRRWTVEGADETGTEAARAALCSFLAGFGLALDHRRSGLVERLLAGGHARRRNHPDKSLAACALEHAEQRFEAWLESVLGPEIATGEATLTIGRAAFLSCGGPSAWPHMILADDGDDDVPEAFVVAMRAAAPSLAPMATPGTMAAQSLESWSITHVVRAAVDVIGGSLARLPNARPLLATIKLTRPTS